MYTIYQFSVNSIQATILDLKRCNLAKSKLVFVYQLSSSETLKMAAIQNS